MAQKRKSAFQISYVTITYRSVLMGLVSVLLLIGVVMYFAFPETASKLISESQIGFGKLLAKMGVSSGSTNTNTPEPGPQQAHFTNIDGTVRVRKASTNTWVVADYSLVLDRGDYVQTGAEGIAKVVFTDGTNYTIKPDSLIAIQENLVNAERQTRVSVQVTTGTVDLTTSILASGSKSQVVLAQTGATASLNSETTAEVVNDPRTDQRTVMVKKGSGEVLREGKSVQLEDYTKVAIPQAGTGEMVKTRELRPPILISPPPNQNVYLDPATKGVNFSWSPVDNVREYHLKISKNASFSDLVVNDRKPTTQVLVTNLPEGVYYWQVLSIGADGKESSESESPRFTVAPKGAGTLALDLDYVQLGHVIEVKGKTEPNARVMVNGQEAVVGGDGTFHHFTNPLPTGENVITVTAQNTKGDVNTVTKQMVIQ